MNALVAFDAGVPAHLRDERFFAVANRLAGGLSTGAPPRVSFKASRYRLISADGAETLVNENNSNGTTLDVIVLDANPNLSKIYYQGKYDANAEGEDAAPACFSEDGIAPSSRAKSPQSRQCGTCPHGAWGSKINDSSGKKGKACADVKKLAVIPVNNLAGDAYMLGIPAASLKAWSALVKSCTGRGYHVGAMIIRLGFNPQASYPELTFTPQAWISEQQMQAISDLIGSEDVTKLVGTGDAPHGGPFVMEQTGMSGVGFNQAQGSAGGVGGAAVHTATAAPQGFVAAQPVATAPVQPPPGMPAHTMQAVHTQAPAMAPAPQPEAAPAPRRRGRPPSNPAAQAPVPAAAPMPAPVMAPAPAPIATPVHSVATTPAAPANMQAMLDNIMKPRG